MINFGSSEKNKTFHMFDKIPSDVWAWENFAVQRGTFSEIIKANKETDIGYKYHVLMFHKQRPRGDIKDVENFQCCLLDPPQYIAALIENRYNGLVIKTFDEIIDEAGNLKNYSSSKLCDEFLEFYLKFHNNISWLKAYKEAFCDGKIK
jgi:hypothetical protein